MNTRHGLTEHRAYLQPMPDGNYLAIVVQEGPGANDFLPGMMASDNEFDQWFIGKVADIHGISPGQPPPPIAERRL